MCRLERKFLKLHISAKFSKKVSHFKREENLQIKPNKVTAGQ